MTGQYEMRVGDAERESTVAELREHFANGRLTQEEFNERVDQAFAAKTRGDLRSVLRDLPSARPLVTAPAPGSRQSGDSGSRRPFGAFAAAMAAVWVLVAMLSVLDLGFGFGRGGGRPLAFVVLIFAFGVLRRLLFGRRRRGRRCGRPF